MGNTLKKESKTRVVLSFDDGRKDNYDVAMPILRYFGLSATFYIATAYVDGTIRQEDSPCVNPSMSIENVCELSEAGYEIACHGDCHRNDMDDVVNGQKKLSKWLGLSSNNKPGFASPESNLSVPYIKSELNKFNSFFSYIRIASYVPESLINRIMRKIALLFRSSILFDIVYKKNLGGNRDGFIATSIPIVNKTTLSQVKSLVNIAIENQTDCILMFHSIVNKESKYANDMWSWSSVKFAALCKWLKQEEKQGRLDVKRTIDLFQR